MSAEHPSFLFAGTTVSSLSYASLVTGDIVSVDRGTDVFHCLSVHDRHSRAGAARTLVTVLAGLIHLLMLFFGCAFVYPIDANSLTFMTLTCQFQAQDTLDGPRTFQ